jgi:hypothetical protein
MRENSTPKQEQKDTQQEISGGNANERRRNGFWRRSALFGGNPTIGSWEPDNIE